MIIRNKHSGYTRDGIRLYPGKGGSGGGSSAPPPDPALIAAQIKSMGYQDQAIQQMMANNADMAPLQKEQLQFGLDSSKTAYGQSQQDRTWALGQRDKLTTQQDRMANDAAEYNADGYQEQLAQQAGEDVSGALKSANGQLDRSLASRGISSSSGAALAAMSSNSLAGAMAGAGAVNNARTVAKDKGYALTDRANNALAGSTNVGLSTTGSGATFGTAGMGLANAALTGMNSGLSSVSGAAGGMGSNASGMYGTQLNAYTSSQNAANAADASGMAGMGQMAGMAMMAF